MAKNAGTKGGKAKDPETGEKEPVVETGGFVFVNREKLERAKGILDLITGKQSPKKESEIERRDHYAAQLADRGIKPSDKEALQALYEILGGLVRTPAEQAQADAQAKKMQARNKKKPIRESEDDE